MRNMKNKTFNKLWQDEHFRSIVSKHNSQIQKNLLKDPEILKERINRLNVYKVCEHCNKEMNAGNYSRWHGDKCKFKQ